MPPNQCMATLRVMRSWDAPQPNRGFATLVDTSRFGGLFLKSHNNRNLIWIRTEGFGRSHAAVCVFAAFSGDNPLIRTLQKAEYHTIPSTDFASHLTNK